MINCPGGQAGLDGDADTLGNLPDFVGECIELAGDGRTSAQMAAAPSQACQPGTTPPVRAASHRPPHGIARTRLY